MILVKVCFFGLAVLFTLVFVMAGYQYFLRKNLQSSQIKKLSLMLNLAFFGSMLFGFILMFGTSAEASETAAVAAGSDLGESIRKGLGYVGMGLATGCAAIGAGIGAGIAGAAGIGAISEKPQMLAKTLIYVGLAEGAAIYGLLISFIIMSKI